MTNERLAELARKGLEIESAETLDHIDRVLVAGAKAPAVLRPAKVVEERQPRKKGAFTEAGLKKLSMIAKRRWKVARKQGRSTL